MPEFTIINTIKLTDPSNVYIALDTIEGTNCFGHWMWECAIFLPQIKELIKTLAKPYKILLNNPKQFKLLILKEFGFTESDIIYSKQMKQVGASWQMNHVFPEEDEYILYCPQFAYLWTITVDTKWFFDYVNNFCSYFKKEPVDKSISVLYLRRSKKENYSLNKREFINIDAFCKLVENNGWTILDIDTLTSFQEQVDIIRKAKTIIMEMGSVYTINAGWLAENSEIIILNDFFGIHSNFSCMQVLKKQVLDRNNTINIFSTTPLGSFTININLFEKITTHLPKLIRDSCVVCENEKFNYIMSFPGYSIHTFPEEKPNSGITYDASIISCEKCKCLQMKKLVDPLQLYSNNYTISTYSPSWLHHNNALSEFILSNTDTNTFLEIGANMGGLYKLLKEKKDIKYSVLDMFKATDFPSDVGFYKGNCEEYDFTGSNTLIMSHVFEHLYNPLKFISNAQKSKVSTIFIAIPNFDYLLINNNFSLIHSQHTYFCGINYIIYMFMKYNYRCTSQHTYDGNFKSYFFKFTYEPAILQLTIPNTDINLYKKIYMDIPTKVSSIDIPKNTYICPSGLYGQYFYYFIKNKENILGFIDNDTKRHNKYLCCTDKLIYSPKAIDYESSNIIIINCPYMDEIKDQLLSINKDAKIINV